MSELFQKGRAKTGGRVKGSRNKLSMAFVEALAKEFNDTARKQSGSCVSKTLQIS